MQDIIPGEFGWLGVEFSRVFFLRPPVNNPVPNHITRIVELVFSRVRELEASQTGILQFPINSFHGYIFCGCLLTQHNDFGS